jgi:NhaP-type Na+/H+ or K+/H+ antiporter
MVIRIAAVSSFIVFAVCLVVGGIQADNTFVTTVERAVTAMLVTLVIGLIIGAMAQKMLQENIKSQQEKLKNNSARTPQGDR